jgi:hypothetical protein
MADKLTTPLTLPELGSAPSNPPSGYQKIYAKSDNKLYVKTSAGTETELTNVAGSGISEAKALMISSLKI